MLVDPIEIVFRCYQIFGKSNSKSFLRDYLKHVLKHLLLPSQYKCVYVSNNNNPADGGFILPSGILDTLKRISLRLFSIQVLDDESKLPNILLKIINHDRVFMKVLGRFTITFRKGQLKGVIWLPNCVVDSNGIFVQVEPVEINEHDVVREEEELEEMSTNRSEPLTRDTRMRPFIVLLLLWLPSCSSKSVFLIEEDDETLSFPIQRGSIDELQEDILNVLGIDYHPLRDGETKPQDASMKYMRELYSALEKFDEKVGERRFDRDTEKAEVVEAINPTDRMLLEGSLWKVEFTSSSMSTEGNLMGASLHFVPSEELKKKLVKVDVLVDIEGQLSLFSEWNALTGEDLPINITSLVLTWRNSFATPKIYLNILTDDGLPPSPSEWSVFIVGTFASVPRVFKESSKVRRTKRSMDDSPSGTSSRPNPFKAKGGRRAACRKHGLYVDFKDLNWSDFVVSPLGFQAYYCSGACSFPLSSTLNATNHAIVQTLAHLLDRRKTNESKCAPLNLLPLQVLFTPRTGGTEQKVVLKRYYDMIVQDCGCQ